MAQLVEHHLAKVGVAGSSPVVRSRNLTAEASASAVFCFRAWSGARTDEVEFRQENRPVRGFVPAGV